METNTISPPVVATLSVRHSGAFTERLDFTSADAFLKTLTDVIAAQGLYAVAAAIVYDDNDLELRYRVHEILVGEYGYSAIPERYWRLSATRDQRLMDKIERLRAFEEAETLEERVTGAVTCCEQDAVIVEPLASRLSDDALLELVDALYEAMPASYRKAG